MSMSLRQTIGDLLAILPIRFGRRAIGDLDALAAFIAARSAHVAQTSLYGYVKARIGTRYPEVFQDTAFGQSLSEARTKLHLACLADLTIFAIALIGDGRLPASACRHAARHCHRRALDVARNDIGAAAVSEAETAFARRLDAVDWASAHHGEDAFRESPSCLVDAAPVVESMKALDQDIVMNSIRFRWVAIRRQLRRRIDRPALLQAIKDLS